MMSWPQLAEYRPLEAPRRDSAGEESHVAADPPAR